MELATFIIPPCCGMLFPIMFWATTGPALGMPDPIIMLLGP